MEGYTLQCGFRALSYLYKVTHGSGPAGAGAPIRTFVIVISFESGVLHATYNKGNRCYSAIVPPTFDSWDGGHALGGVLLPRRPAYLAWMIGHLLWDKTVPHALPTFLTPSRRCLPPPPIRPHLGAPARTLLPAALLALRAALGLRRQLRRRLGRHLLQVRARCAHPGWR